jgi:glucokinase
MTENSAKAEFFVGVDLGGTKIRSGVFTRSLDLRATAKRSTKPQRGAEAVIDRIARCVREAVDEADLDLSHVRGVGIGAPGVVEEQTGQVVFAPNLDWHDVPLKERLEQELDLPVFVDNDCNLAALGVYAAELKPKPRQMLGIFLGTGIGGGLIIDGQLYRGFGHAAGEIGHMVLDLNGPKCGCGQRGCFEALASRTAIFERIKAAVHEGRETVLTELLGDNLDDMRSGDLRKALKRGDKLVDAVIEDAAVYTGIAVANLANVLNPEVIVLGGGLVEALADQMLSIVVETARDYAMPGAMKGVEIVPSLLGDDAGITGGAALTRELS